MECFSKVNPCLDVECEAPACVEHRREWNAYWDAEDKFASQPQLSWKSVDTYDPSDINSPLLPY